jgi:hypothetical protein
LKKPSKLGLSLLDIGAIILNNIRCPRKQMKLVSYMWGLAWEFKSIIPMSEKITYLKVWHSVRNIDLVGSRPFWLDLGPDIWDFVRTMVLRNEPL